MSVVRSCAVGRVQPLGLVQAEHGEGSDGAAAPDSRSGARAAAVRVQPDLGAAAAGRLAGESETGAPSVPPGGVAGADAGPAAQAHGAAPRAGAGPGRSPGALEHGLRP